MKAKKELYGAMRDYLLEDVEVASRLEDIRLELRTKVSLPLLCLHAVNTMAQGMSDSRYWFPTKGFTDKFEAEAAAVLVETKVSYIRSSSDEGEGEDQKDLDPQEKSIDPVKDEDEKELAPQQQLMATGSVDAENSPEDTAATEVSGEKEENKKKDDRARLGLGMLVKIGSTPTSPPPTVVADDSPPTAKKTKKRRRSPSKEKEGSPLPPPESLISFLCHSRQSTILV